jgi:hypothetical protein
MRSKERGFTFHKDAYGNTNLHTRLRAAHGKYGYVCGISVPHRLLTDRPIPEVKLMIGCDWSFLKAFLEL